MGASWNEPLDCTAHHPDYWRKDVEWGISNRPHSPAPGSQLRSNNMFSNPLSE